MNNSLKVLQDAIDLATRKGCFGTAEVVQIANALNSVNKDLIILNQLQNEKKRQ
ncbi:MAG: hypothetical protein ACWA5P_01810 [bacterium]